MSILLTCPYCSGQSAIAEEAAASGSVQCPHCGNLMAVPHDAGAAAAPPAFATNDADAQVDFGQGAPVRDDGSYEHVAPADHGYGRAQPGYVGGTYPPAPGYAPPIQPTWAPGVPGAAPAAPSAYACSGCGGTFPPDQVVDQYGALLCRNCYETSQVAAAAAPPPIQQSFPAPYDGETAASAAPAAETIEVLERCGSCGGAFRPSLMYQVNGRLICDYCAAQAGVPGAGVAATAATGSAPGGGEEAGGDDDSIVMGGGAAAGHDGGGAGETVDDNSLAAATTRAIPRHAKRGPDPVTLSIGAGIAAAAVVGLFLFYNNSSTNRSDNTGPTKVAVNTTSQTRPAPAAGQTQPTTRQAVPPSVSVADWEKTNAAQLRSLQQQAKGRLARKDFEGAGAIYQQLFALADQAGGPVRDPQLRQLLDAAREDWDSVKAKGGTAVAAGPDDGPSPPTTRRSTPTRPTPGDTAPTAAADNPAVAAQVQKLLSEAEYAEKQNNLAAAFARYKDAFELIKREKFNPVDKALAARIAAARKARTELVKELRNRPDSYKITADALMARGYAALAQQKWQPAVEALSDVRLMMEKRVERAQRVKDDDYVNALHGIAAAHIGAGQYPKAGDMFEESATLGIIAQNKKPPDLLWNRGVLDVVQKFRIMRSVKGLMDYLQEDESAPPDERMLNLFGTTISVASMDPPKNPKLLNEAIEYYKKRNAQLEATRPGMTHWGVSWLGGAEAAELERKRQEAQKVFDSKMKELGKIKERRDVVKRGERVPIRRGRSRIYVTRVNQEQLKQVTSEYNAKAKEVNEARSLFPVAQWLTPADLKPIIPGALASAAAAPQPPTTPPTTTGTGPAPAVVDTTPTPPTPPTPPPPAVVAVDTIVRNAVAFPVDRYRLVTAAEPIGSAQSVRLEDAEGNTFTANVVNKGEHLALLEVSPGDVGGGMRFMNLAIGFGGGPVKCAGLPTPSIFGPSAEFIGGKSGDPPVNGTWTVPLDTHPRLGGAPLLDHTDRVVGVVVARRDDPKDKIPVVTLLDLRTFLESAQAMPAEECANPDPAAIYHVVVNVE